MEEHRLERSTDPHPHPADGWQAPGTPGSVWGPALARAFAAAARLRHLSLVLGRGADAAARGEACAPDARAAFRSS
jgi:hypothetical protein